MESAWQREVDDGPRDVTSNKCRWRLLKAIEDNKIEDNKILLLRRAVTMVDASRAMRAFAVQKKRKEKEKRKQHHQESMSTIRKKWQRGSETGVSYILICMQLIGH